MGRLENLVKHYWDCANTLEPETHTHQLLKSYYMTICRKLVAEKIETPKEKFSFNNMCRHCSSKWNETNFRMKLKPQEIAHSAKAKKLIAKLNEAEKGTEQRRALTRKQRKRAKWLKKRVTNSVEITCEFCKHKTYIAMQKPSRREREGGKSKTTDLDEKVSAESVAPSQVKLKKKKKKSKDKTAGIKVDKFQKAIVKSKKPDIQARQTKVDSSNKQNTIESKLFKPQENKKIDASTAKTESTKKCVIKTAVANTQAKSTANLSQPLKAKKKKKAAATPKVQSKTQQQNSLLQLAALLKAQTANKSGTNVAQKRLESLLK